MQVDRIICGDCLEVMRGMGDESVDMILCDLPYGTTQCSWDTIIPFEPLWEQYKRIIKPNGAIVLTASQPFTTKLIASNMGMFKYCWVWDKVRKTGHLDAKRRPMRNTEDVAIFCAGTTPYRPQMITGTPHMRGPFGRRKQNSSVYGNFSDDNRTYESDEYYPDTIIRFCAELQGIHPTQKPVALFEYFIGTYTNEGEVVLDNCIGSGTTAIAAIRTGRHYIGIDISEEYCEIARERIRIEQAQLRLF